MGNAHEIVVNGTTREIEPGASLEGLLKQLGLDARWVVAELNGEPLSRERFANTVLAAGDRLELVRAVAGG